MSDKYPLPTPAVETSPVKHSRPARLLAKLAIALLFIIVAAGAIFWRVNSNSLSPMVVLASNERGRAQFDYSGPGMINYRYSFESFTFEIGPTGGKPWTVGKGDMTLGASNDITITIQSKSDRPYDIQLLGLSTNRNFEVEEEKIKETLRVPAGDKQLTIQRFVIFTYDF